VGIKEGVEIVASFLVGGRVPSCFVEPSLKTVETNNYSYTHCEFCVGLENRTLAALRRSAKSIILAMQEYHDPLVEAIKKGLRGSVSLVKDKGSGDGRSSLSLPPFAQPTFRVVFVYRCVASKLVIVWTPEPEHRADRTELS
jgi:hypothetical protein